MAEFLPLDTKTGRVKTTSSDNGTEPKPFDFSEVHVIGIGGSPPGGTTGQVLTKVSDTDFDTVWEDVSDLIAAVNGITPLVSGQNYIDVTFATAQPSADWILTECHVVNTVDANPLNLAPGILTSKTTAGFRLQLNGAPSSSNYSLHWALGTVASGGGGGGGGGVPVGGTTGQLLKKNSSTDFDVGWGTVSGGGGIEGPVFNVLDYGAVADCVTLLDITMPIGAVVTSAAYTFTEADVGKTAVIRGAVNAGVSPMIATIVSVSGHSATLDKATSIALTTEAHSFPRMDFGTDNTIAFVLTCLAVPGPGNRNQYEAIPFPGAGVMNPVLPGDGGVVYIPRGHYLLKQVNTFPFWFFETNNVHVKGDGMGATVLFYDSTDLGCLLCGGFTGGHGLFQNVTISDFTVWDLNFYTGGGNAINANGIDNLRIERIESVNSRGNGGINVQGYATGGAPVTNRIYIRDCWVHGYEDDSSTSVGTGRGIEGDGMNVGEVSDVYIQNNRIEGSGRHGYEGGGNCLNQYFTGNIFKDCGMSGINPTGGGKTVVIGNTVDGFTGFGIDFTVDVGPYFANDTRVIGNWIKGIGDAGFRFQNTSGDLSIPHIDHIILANNWLEPDTNPSTSAVFLGEYSPSILIEGNWFGNGGRGVVGTFVAAAGKYVIIKNNYFAGSNGALESPQVGNLIIEGNIVVPDLNTYGGSSLTCNIDGQTVLAGAINSATNICQGGRLIDSVEIVRGATTAPQLIIWGVITSVAAFIGTVTTYAYNPTGGSLNTGAATKFIVHRPLRP